MAELKNVCVCVDAEGGDNAPSVVIEGVEKALAADPNLSILLVGREESIAGIAAKHPERIEAIYASEVIEMGDHPANAVRQKKDSSIVVGCKAVKEGRADGFFSAGSTGACLTAATLIIGRIKGIMRPALATVVPSPIKEIILLDCGANADCKPEYLVQFAQMGRAYGECFLGMESPTIGLLSNGSEETKGNQATIAAHELLSGVEGFIGNVEGGDILKATCDVVVTDGFTGNVARKTIEGSASVLFGAIKGIMTSSLGNKLAAAKLKGGLYELKAQIDPDTYGGAPLLGVRAVCHIGHGSSSPKAIANGIATCAKAIRAGLTEKIAGLLGE